MEVTYICFNSIKEKQYYTLPPLNMNAIQIINIVYKIKQAKTEKSGVMDPFKIACILIK